MSAQIIAPSDRSFLSFYLFNPSYDSRENYFQKIIREILDNQKNCAIFSRKEYIIKINFYLLYLLYKFNLNKN